MKPEELLAKQMRFLYHVKNLKLKKLRRLHRKVFPKDHPYWVPLPKWLHRSSIERRLFYYFCLRNYHYPKDHPIYKQFKLNAKHVLSPKYFRGLDPTQQAKQRLSEHGMFTATRIKAMPIAEVDRYLASVSLFVEADETTRRKVLWEWFNKPSNELVQHFNKTGKRVRKRGNLNNNYRLTELILENPTLQYDDFVEAFGEQMPTVSRASYNNTRCMLRKAGHDLPMFKRGPYRPAVVTGPYGKKVANFKPLNDTSLLGVTKDGKEEPF